MDLNQTAEKEEYEHKLQEVQSQLSRYMTKLHGGGGAAGGAQQDPSSCGAQYDGAGAGGPSYGSGGPTVEEVD